MPIYRLNTNDNWFPSPADFEDDIVAVGGDLSNARLLTAYSRGIFPWYNPGEEILWWCPVERCVIFPDEIKVSHSMRNVFNRGHFTFTIDKMFEKVMEECRAPRKGDNGSWISSEIMEAYSQLHRDGFAHSVETWRNGELVGGLYGVSLGRMFFGESMFFKENNASKAAVIFLADVLAKKNFSLIDCQVYNPHLATLGARNIPRSEFLERLEQTLEQETLRGSWSSFASE